MDLLSQTKFLLKKLQTSPDRLKGQNFCIDESVLNKMTEAADIKKNETVLEVGPGFGFLTQRLIENAEKVIAVELDKKLYNNLKKLESIVNNLEVIQGDILDFWQPELTKYKIVANLPYNITSVFLRKFLTMANKPASMTLLVQKEVAERIVAVPGQLSRLAISVQLYGRPEIVSIISPEAFYPSPKVESAILRISNISSFPYAEQVDEKKYWQIIKAGFSAKRKTLANNLKNSLHLSQTEVLALLKKANLNPQVRAQELSLENWLDLSKFLR